MIYHVKVYGPDGWFLRSAVWDTRKPGVWPGCTEIKEWLAMGWAVFINPQEQFVE